MTIDNIAQIGQFGSAALMVVVVTIMYLIMKLVLSSMVDMATAQRAFYVSQVADLKTEIVKLREKSEVEIAALREEIRTLKAEQNKDKARIADQERKIVSLESRLGEANRKVANKAKKPRARKSAQKERN